MNRLVGCACAGLIALFCPPGADAQDGKCLHFTDLTQHAGVGSKVQGKGSAGILIADLDNDGWPDLFVTGLSGGRLYRNNGEGTFTDITCDPHSPQIERIRIEGGKVEITGDSIRVEGGKVEIIRRRQ
jgi:hypothetical protein